MDCDCDIFSEEENWPEERIEDDVYGSECNLQQENPKNTAPVRLSEPIFLQYLKKYGKVLLLKSQTPQVKTEKKAIDEICHHLHIDRGILYTANQVSKKVQNLKAKLKTKVDVRRTGNKKIVLSATEQELSELMHAEDNPGINPVSSGIVLAGPNKTQIGVDASADDDDEQVTPTKSCGIPASFSILKRKILQSSPVPSVESPKKSANIFKGVKTEDTKRLSTRQLQRLVLLKQLQLFQKQELVADLQIKALQ